MNDWDEINKELPVDWYLANTEHNSIIRIESNKLDNHFITIQKWNSSYIVIPYIPNPECSSGSTYYEEQQKICDDLQDALFHATLLIEKWNKDILNQHRNR